MIKILHVISDKNIGGAGKLLLNLISQQNQKSFDIAVAVPSGSLLTNRLTALGTHVYESNLSFWSLVKIIRSEGPHIVHTHASAKARAAAKLCGVAITVNTKHCATDTAKRAGLCKRAINFVFDRFFTSHTIATAHYAKKRLMLDGIPERKISTVINGSLPQKAVSSKEKLILRKKYGYTAEDFLVGMVARIEQGKGHEYFIEAAKLCQSAAPQIKFIIVGDGTMMKKIKESAAELRNLIFTGFMQSVSDIMNILDANANCSYISETSSLSLSEGMSLGVIPVVSDCGGNSFMAKDCGIVVPKKDSKALADALVFLASNKETVQRLKSSAVMRFSSEFTAKAMTEKTERIYLNLLYKRQNKKQIF